jgi:predicted aspartyl protease
MRIDGQWLLCDDGVERPVIHGELLAGGGQWEAVEFLVDTGADRTVLGAAMLRKLCLPPLEAAEDLSGLGGVTDAVFVETTLHLPRETGTAVVFHSQFAAVTDPSALDLSVLGRDILDLFAVIVDRPGDVICLLSQRHRYAVIQN